MDLSFSPEDQAFRADVRGFVEDNLPPDIRDRMKQGLLASKEDSQRWNAILHGKGWVAPAWPVEHGGTGWNTVQIYIYEEEMVRGHAPLDNIFATGLVAPVIIAFGSEAQKAHYLPRILRCADWWCQGYSEPNAGSDLASLKTRAVRDGDDYVVNGTKMWTTWAQYADWIFCLVRTSTEGKKQAGVNDVLAEPQNASKPVADAKPRRGAELYLWIIEHLDASAIEQFFGHIELGHERQSLPGLPAESRNKARHRLQIQPGALQPPRVREKAIVGVERQDPVPPRFLEKKADAAFHFAVSDPARLAPGGQLQGAADRQAEGILGVVEDPIFQLDRNIGHVEATRRLVQDLVAVQNQSFRETVVLAPVVRQARRVVKALDNRVEESRAAAVKRKLDQQLEIVQNAVAESERQSQELAVVVGLVRADDLLPLIVAVLCEDRGGELAAPDRARAIAHRLVEGEIEGVHHSNRQRVGEPRERPGSRRRRRSVGRRIRRRRRLFIGDGSALGWPQIFIGGEGALGWRQIPGLAKSGALDAGGRSEDADGEHQRDDSGNHPSEDNAPRCARPPRS